MESTFAPHTGRLDRHVRRSVLRVGEGVSRHRIAYSLEEALRLATLPGEEEGRIYCFRRVSLSGIPSEANRRVWTEQVQQVLGALAVQAIHASDPNAGEANAAYFNNIEEAFETLLRKAVRATGEARWTTPEWFANSVIGAEPGSSYATQIPAIVERLRPPAMAPAAAASILFAALGDADPVPLLSAIHIDLIREWVGELDLQKSLSASAPPLQLPSEYKLVLQRAASHFGWKDPATVWLAAQAVISLSPSTWSFGTAVKRARATLRILEDEQRREPPNGASTATRHTCPSQLVFDDDHEGSAPINPEPGDRRVASRPQDDAMLSHLHASTDAEPESDQAQTPQKASAVPAPSAIELAELPAAKPPLLGEATQAAGLYFLLNVLHSLGIGSALDSCPELAAANLPAHILRQLAAEAGVAGDDPILRCLDLPLAQFDLPDEFLSDLAQQPQAWPNGFAVPRRAVLESSYFLRVWTVATKRWLWRMGRLTLGVVVNRNGRVWLTRTDLDVTFPLASADLRIRRIGLDIDPGWLPWFGECGRVVRFHYRDRDPEESC